MPTPDAAPVERVRAAPEFFVTAGTLAPSAPSYVVRQADETLLESLRRGEYCYVLDSRQMGKSSLMARAAHRLRQEGAAVAVVDLSKCGENVTVEQWYVNQLLEVGRYLGLSDQLEDYWDSHRSSGALVRYLNAIREVVLREKPGQVVVFIDEVDYVRNLQFSTDELFAGIRECYNARSTDPEMERLSFCLVGVATPTDLIENPDTTPFNIGRRIDLTDFTAREAAVLAAGLGRSPEEAEALIHRVLHWTAGQPYLTQSVCAELARSGDGATPEAVDRICYEQYLKPGRENTNVHLRFVRNRVLESKGLMAAALDLYGKALIHERFRGCGPFYRLLFNRDELADSGTNPAADVLRLAGLIRSQDGYLRVRNRIYARVFNREWVLANTTAERAWAQRQAYRRGLRNAIIPAVLAAALVVLGVHAVVRNVQYRELKAEQAKTRKALDGEQTAKARAQQNLAEAEKARQALRQQAEENKQLADARGRLGERLRERTEQLAASNEKLKQETLRANLAASDAHDYADRQGKSAADAKAAQDRAEKLAKEKEEEAAQHRQLREQAFGRELAMRANLIRTQEPDQVERSLLLALESLRVYHQAEADRAVREDLDLLPRPLNRVSSNQAYLPWSGLTRDGSKVLAIGGRGRPEEIHLWRLSQPGGGEQVIPLPGTEEGQQFRWYSVAPSGERMAIVSIRERGLPLSSVMHLADLAAGRARELKLPPALNCVTDVAFLTNDRLAAVPCGGQAPFVLEVNKAPVQAAALEPPARKGREHLALAEVHGSEGGRLLGLLASTDSARATQATLQVWDVATRKPVRGLDLSLQSLVGSAGSGPLIRFSPNGRFVFIEDQPGEASGRGGVRPEETARCEIWDVDSGERTALRHPPSERILAVAFHHGKTRDLLAFGSTDHSARVLDLRRGLVELMRVDHRGQVNHVAISGDGSKLATASADGTARVWYIDAGEAPVGDIEVTRMPLGGREGLEVAFSADGRAVAALYSDRREGPFGVTVSEASAREEKVRWPAPLYADRLLFDPGAEAVFAGPVRHPAGAHVILWNLREGREAARIYEPSTISAVAFSPDGKRLCIGNAGGSVRIWDTAQGRELQRLSGTWGRVDGLVVSPSGRLLAFRSGSAIRGESTVVVQALLGSRISTFAVKAGASQTAYLEEGSNQIRTVRVEAPVFFGFSGDEKHLLWLDQDGGQDRFRVFDFTGREVGRPIQRPWIRFSRDGARGVALESDRRQVVWFEPASGRKQGLLALDGGPFAQGALSPDGTVAALATGPGELVFVNLRESKVIRRVKRLGGRWERTLWSKDSTRLAAVSIAESVIFDRQGSEIARVRTGAGAGQLPFFDHFEGRVILSGEELSYLYWGREFGTSMPLDGVARELSGSGLLALVNAGRGEDSVASLQARMPAITKASWRDSKTGALLRGAELPGLAALAHHPERGLLASAPLNREEVQISRVVRKGDVIELQPVCQPVRVKYVSDMVFDQEGRRLALAAGETLLVVEVPSGTELLRRNYDREVTCPRFVPGGWLAVGSGTTVEWLRASDWGVQRRQSLPDKVSFVAAGEAASWIVAAVSGSVVWLSPEGGDQGTAITWPPEDPTGLAMHPNGRVAAVTYGNSVYVAERGAGRPVLLQHDSRVAVEAFNPSDPDYLLTRTARLTHVWNSRTRTEISRISQPSTIETAAFTPDGTYVVSVSDRRVTHSLWRRQDLLAEACGRLTRGALDAREWREYFGAESDPQRTCPSVAALPGAR